MTGISLRQLDEFLDKVDRQDIADIGGAVGHHYDGSIIKLYKDNCNFRIYDLENGYDICKKSLPRKHKTIVCVDTFEHIKDPVRAAENIVKSLQLKGNLFVTAPFIYEQHNYPIDMYRYTDTAFKWLFRKLKIIKCWYEDETPHPEIFRRIRVSLIAKNE